MKNQNDLIFSIVFGVLGLIAFGIAFATKPEPPTIPAPPSVTTTDAALPTASVQMGNALPGASGTAGGSGSFGGPGGFPGGPGGFGGFSGGMPGMPGGPGGYRPPMGPPGGMAPGGASK